MPRKKRPSAPLKLTPIQRAAARSTVEQAELAPRPLTDPMRYAIIVTFGENPPMPDGVLVGPLACCRCEEDGSDPQIVVHEGSTTEVFIHEYAHWLALTLHPKLSVTVGREAMERWAEFCQEAYRANMLIPYPNRACQQFLLACADQEGG